MSSQGWGIGLRGRDSECEALRGLISTVRAGSCGVLVLRGEAGVGKSALLSYLSEQAQGFRCVEVAGVESDMELAFAGLQQLCAPLIDRLDHLPEPQREALNVAFGRTGGPAPDRFLVGLAVLSLMAAASADQPVLCIVDDAQWLDQVSVQTLAFVARRLLAEPVALVFAARDSGAEVLAGLPEIPVKGLSDEAARDLLESVMLGGIDPRVRDRIIAETRGVPLAILEVPRSITATELAGGFWISGKRSSTAAIEEGFVRRIRSLPAADPEPAAGRGGGTRRRRKLVPARRGGVGYPDRRTGARRVRWVDRVRLAHALRASVDALRRLPRRRTHAAS
jgi:hypothetical protein